MSLKINGNLCNDTLRHTTEIETFLCAVPFPVNKAPLVCVVYIILSCRAMSDHPWCITALKLHNHTIKVIPSVAEYISTLKEKRYELVF